MSQIYKASTGGGGGSVTSVNGTPNQILANPTTGAVFLSLIGPYTPATYTAHGVLVGEGTSSIVAVGPTANTGAVLQNNAGADPSYSTATYPSTTTINQILYSSAANTVTGLATGNNGVLITSSTGVPSLLANGTTGQVLTATTGSPPTWETPSFSNVYTNVTTAMSPYTVTATDYFISCDATAGPIVINLPDSPAANREFVVKDRVGIAATNSITVKSLTGAATIDTKASYVFSDNFESLDCLFHGTNYEIF